MFNIFRSNNQNITIQQNETEMSPDIAKLNMQNEMIKNDISDLNMFVLYRGALFRGSIFTSFCATLGLSTLALYNIMPNIMPFFRISNLGKIFPVGMFIIGGSLNMLFNQLDTKLEIQQKKLLNKYKINTETYVDQNTVNDIPTPIDTTLVPNQNKLLTDTKTNS